MPHRELVGKADRLGAVALGQESRLLRAQHVGLLRQHIDGGLRLGLLEHDQGLADLDPVPFLDPQFLDDAAVEMLDGLAVALDLDDRRGDNRTVQRRIAAQPPSPRKKAAMTASPAMTAPRALSLGTGTGCAGWSMIRSGIVKFKNQSSKKANARPYTAQRTRK